MARARTRFGRASGSSPRGAGAPLSGAARLGPAERRADARSGPEVANDGSGAVVTLALLYDVSRLTTRVLRTTPNGIDRIDLLLAEWAASDACEAYPLLFGPRGPRLFKPGALPWPMSTLTAVWKESDVAAGAESHPVFAALTGGPPQPPQPPSRSPRPRRPSGLSSARARAVAQALWRYGPRWGQDPRALAPWGAVYLNAAHFPLAWGRHTAWLDDRPDVKPVAVLHDLLPVQRPDDFWRKEPERHGRRLAFLARRGAGAIVHSRTVAEALAAWMAAHGRPDLPILTLRAPVAPAFLARRAADPSLAAAPFFLVCGTIEPRKNHRLLAAVWRRLVENLGARAPRLVVAGKQGWDCASIMADLRAPPLRHYVLIAEGLSTPEMRRLMGAARAVLAPSFDEGFGLTVQEALTVGAPVIGSDIPAFRDQADGRMVFLDPFDEEGWTQAIVAHLRAPPQAPAFHPVLPGDYTRRIAAFLGGL